MSKKVSGGNDASHLRNIGIAAHIDAGKTTLTERILFYSGKVHRMGEVDQGSATMDWMPQERERGITITSAATTTTWEKHQINIIDTPGHVDFTVEVQRALRVLDGMVAVFCAVGGVEPQSETVWRQANQYHVPRIAFINKLDRTGADFEEALTMMREKLGARAMPVSIPVGEGADFEGIIDLLDMKFLKFDEQSYGKVYDIVDIPEEHLEMAKTARWELLEIISEDDEEIMMMLLDEEEPEKEQIISAIRHSVIHKKFVPVLCGSALHNKGVQSVLDAIIRYLPSPEDIIEVDAFEPDSMNPIKIQLDDDKLTALVFKIATDKFIGRVSFARIYSGTLDIKSSYLNPREGKRERINKIFRINSDQRTELQSVSAGEVVGLAGLRFTKTGDTLCDQKNPVVFEEMHFPEPVIFVAIEPRTQADMDKLVKVLGQLQDEDPTVKVRIDPDTGQTILSGMGELHLEILIDRMKQEFNVDALVGNPQVSYRETIVSNSKAEGVFEKTIGETLQYGAVKIELYPLHDPNDDGPIDEDKKFELTFSPKIDTKHIDSKLIEAVQTSIQASAESGPIGGYPLVGIGVKVLEMDVNEESSTEMAFRIAAGNAFSTAIRSAEPKLLEPVMKIEILMPDSYVGDVISDLGVRGAQVSGIDQKQDIKKIEAISPLSEMFGYTTTLRSLTQGRGSYTMEFDSFRKLNPNKEQALLKKLRGY